MDIEAIVESVRAKPLLRDRPDYRDYPMRARLKVFTTVLPARFDRRKDMTTIRDQGNRSTCTSFAFVASMEQFFSARAGGPLDLSEEYLYKRTKESEPDYPGAGAYMRDAAMAAVSNGACTERLMPYLPDAPEDIWMTEVISSAQDEEASKYVAKEAVSVGNSVAEIKAAVKDIGSVQIGVDLYQGFEFAAKNGGFFISPVGSEPYVGGHAMEVCGWDDYLKNSTSGDIGHFIIKNSWGTDNGDKGYYYLPYSYIGPDTHSHWALIFNRSINMNAPFTDVQQYPWAWEALQYFKDAGDVQGYPDGSLKLGQDGIRLLVAQYRYLKRKNLL